MKNGTMGKYFLCVTLWICFCGLATAQVGIGKWRDHFSFRTTYRVEPAKERIYVQGKLGLFYYDTEDQTVNKLTKIEGLTDVGVSTIAFDDKTGYLAVAYTNSNLDLVRDDRTYNLSDIKRSDISGDKSIYSIRFRKGKAYLSCGFGVAVIDLERKEIADIYRLGVDGSSLKINDIAFFDNKIIAALDSGFISADADGRFLNIFTYWHRDSVSTIKSKSISKFECVGDKILAVVKDSAKTEIYISSDLATFDKWMEGDLHSVRVSDNKITVTTGDSAKVYNADLSLYVNFGKIDWADISANDATFYKSTVWIAHQWAGFTFIDTHKPNEIGYMLPSSPYFDDSYRFIPVKDGMYLAHGSILGIYYLAAQLSLHKNNQWTCLSGSPAMDTCMDISDVVVDPRNSNHLYAASWENGILEINNGRITEVFTNHNTNNAIALTVLGDYHATRTGTAAVDNENNFWFTNSMQNNALVVRRKNGTWANFETNTGNEEITALMIDSVYNYKWFIGNANRIYVHDGINQFAIVNPNNGSKLNTSKVNCICQDHDNEIWIGTEKGIKVIYSTYNAFDNGGNGGTSPITCNNILYSEGDNIEYLLAYENITCIAVDGANRKWIGTATGGVFLISENGTEQLLHFSSSNSPLPSDKITAIGIQPNSGEVFIGTSNGIVSYRGTATYAESKPSDTIYAFPNPVYKDFKGNIGIKGLTRNALVHITDATGHVVFSTKAHGGQAVWNARTPSGKRVASGVYYVFASDEFGENRSTTKIMIIN